MFYHFEPLTLFGYESDNTEVKMKFLKEIFLECRTPLYSEYSKYSINDTTVLNVCAMEDICFWFNSRRFCSPPFCSKTVKDHADTCRWANGCGPGPAKKQDLLESVCKTETKATVAKIIRLPDILPLLRLFHENEAVINGKIILLKLNTAMYEYKTQVRLFKLIPDYKLLHLK